MARGDPRPAREDQHLRTTVAMVPTQAGGCMAPATHTERKFAGPHWQNFGREPVGLNDDFCARRGHLIQVPMLLGAHRGGRGRERFARRSGERSRRLPQQCFVGATWLSACAAAREESGRSLKPHLAPCAVTRSWDPPRTCRWKAPGRYFRHMRIHMHSRAPQAE